MDILIAKPNVTVESKSGDADSLLAAQRFKAMFVKGDILGLYRVALDFKATHPSAALVSATPVLLGTLGRLCLRSLARHLSFR